MPASWVAETKSFYDTATQNMYLSTAFVQSAADAAKYVQVAEALGFTRREIQALVECNDSHVPFAAIADLIDSHPVVYSWALTPTRGADETRFVQRCREVRSARWATS